MVLGHEGAGVVVAVGEGVSSVKPGDHVIPLYTAECRECEFCRSGKTNLCVSVRDTQGKGLMPDGTTRFSYQGQPIYHYMGCSTFSEYSVVAEVSLAKINLKPTTNKYAYSAVALLQVLVRYIIRQKYKKATLLPCLAWGRLVWLSCKVRVKLKPAALLLLIPILQKFELAKQFGATDCLNPNDYDKPIKDVLLDINKWGY